MGKGKVQKKRISMRHIIYSNECNGWIWKPLWFVKYGLGLCAIPCALDCHCHYESATRLNERIKGRDISILAVIHVSLLSWDLNCGSLKTSFNHFNESIISLLTEMSLMSLQGPHLIYSIVVTIDFSFFFSSDTFIFNEPGFLLAPQRQSKSGTHTVGSPGGAPDTSQPYRMKVQKIR